MISLSQETQIAEQMVERFVRRFEPSYKLLAYHAALPLVLTPELLNFLRVQFLRGEVPWMAEVDLLLSDLCSQVGYELYAMDTAIRAYLLEEMKRELGARRMQEIARLLISYVKHLHQNNPYISPKELQAQQWAAMVYIEPETAVKEIASEFNGLVNKAELARLSKIVNELKPQLENYSELIAYAEDISNILFNKNSKSTELSSRSYLVTSDVVFNLPSEFIAIKKVETVLLVEDEPEVVQSVSKILSDDYSIQVKTSENVRQIIKLSQSGEVDLILINYGLSNSFYQNKKVNGIDVTRILKSISNIYPNLPIIGFSWYKDFQEEFLTYGDGFYIKDVKDYQKFVNYINMVFGRVQQKSVIQTSTNYSLNLNFSEFEVATVNKQGEIINRELHQANYFTEDLGDDVAIEMVYIPGGTFIMGSPQDEEKRYEDEGLQHEVTVSPFFIGKYPVTQKQWHMIASLPQVNRELKLNPFDFEDSNNPVEQIEFLDAIEFCDRLSEYTGKVYRLPSEAEWEYACRAGTTTPFYFGETITTNLANYNGNSTYANTPKGKYRRQTTPVGIFPPNNFGLYDMHGNVWEWCADTAHENYQGAPQDGSAWIDDKNQKVLRGGSCAVKPWNCRSACRFISYKKDDIFDFGFRVVCVPSSISNQ